ncbi:MAG: ABC transporter substrate-binding protein [Streptosporangiales bacterium]
MRTGAVVMGTPLVSRRSLLKGAGTGVAGALVLAGCGNASTAEPGDGGADAVTVKDQRGKEVTFPHPVRRVVTLPVPTAAMLIAADRSADHLVGMERRSWIAARDGILGEMFPRTRNLPHGVASKSFVPNVESILGLNPDAVVQWADHGPGLITPMENAGLKVVGLDYGTQHDLEVWIRLFAGMLGKPERGKAMLSRMHADLTAVKKAAQKARPPKPKIIYIFMAQGEVKVAGGQSYNDYYIKLIGARNPASEGTGLTGSGAGVDIEQILAWDPDVVLLSNFDDATPDDLYGDKVWKGVSAVKSRRVYKIPLGGYRWDPPSHESPLMWRWLSTVAFPEQDGIDLRAKIVDYYRFLYGYHPSDKQIDEILWMDLNAGSAAYEQFARR